MFSRIESINSAMLCRPIWGVAAKPKCPIQVDIFRFPKLAGKEYEVAQ